MPTSFPMSNPWVHNELVDEVDLQARVTVPINDLADRSLLLGYASGSTAFTSTGATEALSTELLFTVAGIVSGKTYWVEWGGRYIVSAVNLTAQSIVHGSQSAITTASPVIATCQQYVPQTANGPELQQRARWVPGASGTWNFQVGIKTSAGSGNSQLSASAQPMYLALFLA